MEYAFKEGVILGNVTGVSRVDRMGFAIFLNYCRDSLKSGGTQDS